MFSDEVTLICVCSVVRPRQSVRVECKLILYFFSLWFAHSLLVAASVRMYACCDVRATLYIYECLEKEECYGLNNSLTVRILF